MSNPYPEYKRNTITVPATVVSVSRLQKCEWVGLTDEQIRDLWSWSMTAGAERTANTQQHAFARAIEAKLKEKNHD